MRGWLRTQPIGMRITIGFLLAMSVLLLATSAFVYERMQFALDRQIHDVPAVNDREILIRERHRDEALHELLAQLGAACALTLAVSGLIGHRTARAALDPVDKMQKKARQIRADDPTAQLPVPDTHDELTRLATTLNDLLRRIRASVEHERRFIADASHELRTPLSLLKIQIDLTRSRPRTPAELHHALDRIGIETEHLIKLANDLLLVARADEGSLNLSTEAVQLRDIAHAAARPFLHQLEGAGRTIEIDVSPYTRTRGDTEQLRRAIGNLIDNAITYGDGAITVTTRTNAGRDIEIHVTDQGPGIPEDFIQNAFDRFTTVRPGRTAGGTGLGLAIVKAIAEAHAGSAHVSNRPSGGADTWIILPSFEP